MKVLLVTQHYWPEPFNSTAIAEGLAKRGHDVTVLTGKPNYPEGKIYAGYTAGSVMREERGGVGIVRSPLHPRGRSLPHRVWNYYSFAREAKRVARALPSDFDVVMCYQTSPVMMAEPAIAYAERTGVPFLLYCLDIWPECLTAGGIAIDSPIYNHFRKVARRIYGAADLLAVSSPLFMDYWRDVVGLDVDHSLFLPHFAEEAPANTLGQPEDYDPSKLNLTFAGNVGSAQSVHTIVKAAAVLRDDPRFAFHVVGSGSDLERCQELAAQLGADNVTFHGRKPAESMPAYFAASDALLVTFARNRLLGYTLPRKVTDYLAAGKPILAAAEGETRRVVNEAGCGFCTDAEDFEGLARACLAFADSPRHDELGCNARAYYEGQFREERFFEVLEDGLEQLKGTEHGH